MTEQEKQQDRAYKASRLFMSRPDEKLAAILKSLPIQQQDTIFDRFADFLVWVEDGAKADDLPIRGVFIESDDTDYEALEILEIKLLRVAKKLKTKLDPLFVALNLPPFEDTRFDLSEDKSFEFACKIMDTFWKVAYEKSQQNTVEDVPSEIIDFVPSEIIDFVPPPIKETRLVFREWEKMEDSEFSVTGWHFDNGDRLGDDWRITTALRTDEFGNITLALAEREVFFKND